MSLKALAAMPNLGKTSAAMLAEVGIDSPEALREAGAARAYHLLCFRHGKRVSKNFLWAIEGALTDINCIHLPPERKAALLAELERLASR